MDWKEFFRPTIKRLILTVIIFILLMPLLYIYEMGFTHPNSTNQCMGCPDNVDPNSIIDTPKTGPVKAKYLCCNLIMKNSPFIIIPGVYFRSIFFMARYPFSFLLLIIPSYLISNFIFYMKKLSKR